MNIEVYSSHTDLTCLTSAHYLEYSPIKADFQILRSHHPLLKAPRLKPQKFAGESPSPLLLPPSVVKEEWEFDGESKYIIPNRMAKSTSIEEGKDQTKHDLEMGLILHEHCNGKHSEFGSLCFSFKTDKEHQPEEEDTTFGVIQHSANTVSGNEKPSPSSEEFMIKTSMEQSNQIKCSTEQNSEMIFSLQQRSVETFTCSNDGSKKSKAQSKFTKTQWTMNSEQETEFCEAFCEYSMRPIISLLRKLSNEVK